MWRAAFLSPAPPRRWATAHRTTAPSLPYFCTMKKPTTPVRRSSVPVTSATHRLRGKAISHSTAHVPPTTKRSWANAWESLSTISAAAAWAPIRSSARRKPFVTSPPKPAVGVRWLMEEPARRIEKTRRKGRDRCEPERQWRQPCAWKSSVTPSSSARGTSPHPRIASFRHRDAGPTA